MIMITEHEKAYMIAKAKHEARFETLMTIQGQLYIKARNINTVLYSKEAINIYYSTMGMKFNRINILRTILISKERAYYNASGKYYEQALKEMNDWKMNNQVEGLF